MNRKSLLWILLAIAVVIGCFFLLKNKEPDISQKKIVKIGAILPLTGKAAVVGNMARDGLLFAQIYINDSILQKTNKKIEIIIEDGEGSPTKSLSALNKLLIRHNCNIVFSIISPVDLSILTIQKKQKFLFISHASHPRLSNVNNLVFRHSQTVEQEFKVIDKAIGQDWNEVAYIYVNDDYGTSFNNLIKQNNSNHYSEIAINSNEGVNKSVIDKMLNRKPKYIVLNGSTPILMQVINALKEKAFKGEIYLCLGFAATGGMTQDLSGLSINCIDFNLETQSNNISEAFEANFHSKFGPNQIIFFNSALLIGNAIREGYVMPTNIAGYIKSLKEFKGVNERIVISATNDILPPIMLKKIN